MWKSLAATILCFGLVAGCSEPYICAGKTIRFTNNQTPEWLADNDRPVLEDIIVNNETRAAMNCAD